MVAVVECGIDAAPPSYSGTGGNAACAAAGIHIRYMCTMCVQSRMVETRYLRISTWLPCAANATSGGTGKTRYQGPARGRLRCKNDWNWMPVSQKRLVILEGPGDRRTTRWVDVLLRAGEPDFSDSYAGGEVEHEVEIVVPWLETPERWCTVILDQIEWNIVGFSQAEKSSLGSGGAGAYNLKLQR